jgi:soluble lytic murein transglycosylase-like protein
MFPTRLYGARLRVFTTALVLLAILLLALSAHAEGRNLIRHAWAWHHHHPVRHGHRIVARRVAESAMPELAPTPEVEVLGRSISIGPASTMEEEPRQPPTLFQVSLGLPLSDVGFSVDAGPKYSQSRVAEIVRAKAEMLGVPVELALAITRYESGGRCDMHGRAGERGAMQVLPQTAHSVGVAGDLYDCATGIEAGLRYLKLAVAMHADAGWCAVASAYNSGTWQASHCTRYGRAIAARMR